MFLWTSTRTDLRGTNVMGLGSHTLVTFPMAKKRIKKRKGKQAKDLYI
jgi:hypothetical protein